LNQCSVVGKLEIVEGELSDYKRLAYLHYRQGRLGAFERVYAIRPKRRLSGGFGIETVGVIVYTLPSPGCELRNVATGGFFCGFDRSSRVGLIDKNIRCIGRVIVEPRFRVLGLASRLVRETMPKMGRAMIEAMAVMGAVNPFFEKAGMKAYVGKMPGRCVQLLEAFSMVGVEEDDLVEPGRVERKLGGLGAVERDFIEGQIGEFLQSYGKRRYMAGGVERLRFVLSKLTERPVYYVWFNPGMGLGFGL